MKTSLFKFTIGSHERFAAATAFQQFATETMRRMGNPWAVCIATKYTFGTLSLSANCQDDCRALLRAEAERVGGMVSSEV